MKNKQIKNSVLLAFFLVMLAQTVLAQDDRLPADTYFYKPNIGKALIVIDAGNGTDDSKQFNEAIESINKQGGGIVRVMDGLYYLKDVKLLSNVHVRVNPGVTFRFIEQRSDLFTTPAYYRDKDAIPVNNFSLEGEGGRFSVDFTQGRKDSWLSFISVRSGYNFRFANFNVNDNYTPLSVICVGPVVTDDIDWSDWDNPLFASPNSGIIENIDVYHSHFGYGLIQTQAGQKMLFRNLFGVGGVTLRLETGLGSLAWLNKKAPNLDDLFVRNIININGHCGVALTPHTISHGVVDVKGVRTFSSAHAVSIGHGFLSARKNETDPKLGLSPGDFDPRSIVEDVVAIFGQNAQLKTQYFAHLPDELYVERKDGIGISPDYGNARPSKVHIGPSVCAVKYGAVSVLDPSDDKAIDLREETVKAYGFSDQLPSNGIIRTGEYEFEHKALDLDYEK